MNSCSEKDHYAVANFIAKILFRVPISGAMFTAVIYPIELVEYSSWTGRKSWLVDLTSFEKQGGKTEIQISEVYIPTCSIIAKVISIDSERFAEAGIHISITYSFASWTPLVNSHNLH